MKLNKKDILILQDLHGTKMPSYTDLSTRIGLPESTIRYRVDRMENAGVIKGYSAIVDPLKLGLHAAIVVGNNLPSDKLFFDTAGKAERISILMDEYQSLYTEVIRELRGEAEIIDVLPVTRTNVHVTTWNIEDVLRKLKI